MLAAAVLVVVLLSFSGCLHLDGLADTADGFLSSRPRERILEIMKDSHIGAMGVIAIVCLLLLKFASLASLPAATLWPAVLLMPLAGRCAIVVHMALLPYARPSGLGAIFYRRRPRWAAVWAAAVLAVVCTAFLGWRGLLLWAVCMAVTGAFSVYVYRKIGGATGDTFGAVCEIVEAVPAIVFAMGILCGCPNSPPLPLETAEKVSANTTYSTEYSVLSTIGCDSMGLLQRSPLGGWGKGSLVGPIGTPLTPALSRGERGTFTPTLSRRERGSFVVGRRDVTDG